MAMVKDTPGRQRILLQDISWQYYLQTLREFDERHLRITYDDGFMELMTLSVQHNHARATLSRLFEHYANLTETPIEGMGQLTCFRTALKKGFDPDECYYTSNPIFVDDGPELPEHPTPDLLLEVDVDPSLLDRPAIFAAIGVPELWILKDRAVRWFRLECGRYVPSDRSAVYTALDLSIFNRYLRLCFETSQHEGIVAFADWFAQNVRC